MATEAWTLDGVTLASGNFTLLELDVTPPKERPDWISAADSEGAALMRQPLHENRVITMKLRVTAQANMNTALDQVGAVRDGQAVLAGHGDADVNGVFVDAVRDP
jgi:hypothetical protein